LTTWSRSSPLRGFTASLHFGNGPKGVTPTKPSGPALDRPAARAVRDALASGNPATAARTMQDHIETIIGFCRPQLLEAVRADPAWR